MLTTETPETLGSLDNRIAAIILTKNEELDLPDCLESLRGLADAVYVIDSGSSDKTVELAQAAGAVVLHHPFESYAHQLNWAIENIPPDAGWVLRIDADERPDQRQRDSIRRIIKTATPEITGVMVARRTEFLGKRLRYGGTFPVWLLRAWRRGYGRCEQRWMDEHIILSKGESVRAEGELLHIIPKSLAEWSRKHVWYAERECLDVLGSAEAEALEGQAGRIRKAKSAVYYRAPALLRPLLFWAYRYFAQFGFLDGRVGFIYHFLQCAWYRMLVDAMLAEHERNRAERNH